MRTKLLLFSLFFSVSLAFGARDNLSGAFFQFEGMTPQVIQNYLDETASRGIFNIATIGTMTCVDPNDPNSDYMWNEPGNPGLLPVLFSEASKRGMHVYIGLLATESCTQNHDAAQTEWLVNYILTNFGKESSLAGWYIGNEPYLEDDRWVDSEIVYYKDQVTAIRKYSNLLTVVSPYLVSQWPGSPDAAGKTLKKFLDATQVDVALYEDGMGGRLGSNLGWNTSPNIHDYFTALSSNVGAAHLGIVHELFNANFGIDESSPSSASITRLNHQIEMVPDSLIRPGFRYTWIDQFLNTKVIPTRNQDAERLFDSYNSTHGFSADRLLVPKQINWWTPTDSKITEQPAAGLPDYSSFCTTSYGSTMLKDGVIGDVFTPNNSEWTGTPGFGTLCVDLGAVYNVAWVNLYAARKAALGVQIPQSMSVQGSLTGHDTWLNFFTRSFKTRNGSDGEWDIGNIIPINQSVRYLWIYLQNDIGSTRIGEVEIIVH